MMDFFLWRGLIFYGDFINVIGVLVFFIVYLLEKGFKLYFEGGIWKMIFGICEREVV